MMNFLLLCRYHALIAPLVAFAFIVTSLDSTALPVTSTNFQPQTVANTNLDKAEELRNRNFKESEKGSFKLAKGGVSDGGSVGVLLGQRLILLDLYLAQGDLQEAPGNSLITNQVAWNHKVPHVAVKEQPASRYALQLLRNWKGSTAVGSLIQSALERMEFWAYDEIPEGGRYELPKDLQGTFKLHTLAVYGEQYGGAAISRSRWNQMGLQSQAGVLIHEAIRHIQSVDESENSGKQHLTDRMIQGLTAEIVLGKPLQIPTAELGWFLQVVIWSHQLPDLQIEVDQICAEALKILSPQSESKANLLVQVCKSPVSAVADARLTQFRILAEQLTEFIPILLRTEVGTSFLQVRDRALLLYLRALKASIIEQRFIFSQLRFQLHGMTNEIRER